MVEACLGDVEVGRDVGIAETIEAGGLNETLGNIKDAACRACRGRAVRSVALPCCAA
jgi:hypothetical protein